VDQGVSEALARLSIELDAPTEWNGLMLSRIERSEDPAKEGAKWTQVAEDIERYRRLRTNGVPEEGGAATRPAAEAPKQLPKTRSAQDAAEELKRIAAHIPDETERDDYIQMALYMQAGKVQEARKLAQDYNEDDPGRRALLKAIFPDLDEPY
jgi:hypothetical protein